MTKRFQPLAITTGDHQGIGPEVIAKGLARVKKSIAQDRVVIFGLPELYRRHKRNLLARWQIWTEAELFHSDWTGPKKNHLNFVVPSSNRIPADKRAAYLCGRYIELATKGALEGKFSGIVTGPIEKKELQRGGYNFDGHTDMLKSLCRSETVTMMMAGPRMRISLVTGHLPLQLVAGAITSRAILNCIENTVGSLKRDFLLKKPRIAVLGLNPHAGDKGLFGSEEQKTIGPTIEAAQSFHKDAVITGPFPADGFFALWENRHSKSFDAIVCMYHDQGLIPVKLFDFENTVNVTLGLPIVRTSVDHGVGYDIAGKNLADPSSFCAALKLAVTIGKNRARVLQKA